MVVRLTLMQKHTSSYFTTFGDGKVRSGAIIDHCAKVAGECYDAEGWDKLSQEKPEVTKRREIMTLGPDDGSGLGNEHASPYEHVVIGLEIVGPKILMMLLNNEKQCVTSEKSARYTKFTPENGISSLEAELYAAWLPIFEELIQAKYGGEPYVKPKITKLAQENARYLTSVFAQTRMVHTVPWIQLNRVAGWIEEFVAEYLHGADAFYRRIAETCVEYLDELGRLGVLDRRAMSNRKGRKLSLFGDHAFERCCTNAEVYSLHYKGSLAQLAQAHRHRTISYSMTFLPKTEFYTPPILLDDPELVGRWLDDMELVAENYPQGMLVNINEAGTVEAFKLKCQERLCSAAQLEIMQQTRDTYGQLPGSKRLQGARCVQFGYPCAKPCDWAAGINLTRVI